jgi:hypothetical protein
MISVRGRYLSSLPAAMDQRIFTTQLNVEHYGQKLLTEQDEGTRRRIVQLLAEEEAKLAALTNPTVS